MAEIKPLKLTDLGGGAGKLEEFAVGDTLPPSMLPPNSAGGSKNKIINGNFDVWQRGITFNNPTTYTADRWSVNPNSLSGGATYSVFQAQAAQDLVAWGAYNVIRISVSVVGSMSYIDLSQPIENVGTLQGKPITVSFLHRFGTTAKSIGVYFVQNFGVGGSATVSGQIGATITGSNNAAFTKVAATGTLPSLSGKTIGAGSSVSILIRLLGIPNAGDWVDISQVQVEEGSVATPFEHRPYGQELALCQRYYEVLEARTGGYHTAGGYLRTSAYYKVTKRVSPSLTFVVVESSNAGTVGGDGNPSAVRYLHTVLSTGDVYTQSVITASAEL
jgi:hypothetical protein